MTKQTAESALFERPDDGTRALLINASPDAPAADIHHAELEEFFHLASSVGLELIDHIDMLRHHPHPRFFLGTGKVDEIALQIADQDIEIVVFNQELSAGQQRNLEERLECRVQTRTGLILDVFGARARTHEGKLQVELAQLRHAATRLVRGWTHLDRQRGGGTNLRGAGETQLEMDQRMLADRIRQLSQRLAKVRRHRSQSRRRRSRVGTPTVVCVGYTNAGKSTLFNSLTGSEVYEADQLFATLDPTVRRLAIPGFGEVALSDTVGFIRHLPHSLVDAFKATLEEVAEADLLLHVHDAAAEDASERAAQVLKVLAEIGAAEVPRIDVYNKIDQLEQVTPHAGVGADGKPALWLSARERSGFDLLLEQMAQMLGGTLQHVHARLLPSAGRLRAWLYERDAVLAEHTDEHGAPLLELRMSRADIKELEQSDELTLEPVADADADYDADLEGASESDIEPELDADISSASTVTGAMGSNLH